MPRGSLVLKYAKTVNNTYTTTITIKYLQRVVIGKGHAEFQHKECLKIG